MRPAWAFVLSALLAIAGIADLALPATAATGTGIDLSGRWLLQYAPAGQNHHPYSVQLAEAPAAECADAALPAPCYGGSWWNITAARTEARGVFGAVRSASEITLDGIDGGGTYRYHGTAPATSASPVFSGTFDNRAGTAPATFTLATTPYVPSQEAALGSYPGSLDLTGDWRLDYTPRDGRALPYTISLARQPDDLCSGAFALGPPCFGGAWRNVRAQRDEGRGFFSATVSNGQVRLTGADEVSGSPQHYAGTVAVGGADRLSIPGTFDNDAGTLPATFRFTAVQAPVLPAGGRVLPDRYIVALTTAPTPSRAAATTRAIETGATVTSEYRAAFSGFAARLSPEQLTAVRHDPDVSYVVPVTANYRTQEADVPWGLDRLDQKMPAGNGSYLPPGSGAGVHVYVVDSGVDGTQPDFDAGTGSRVTQGADFVDGSNDATCWPHGTEVAGLAVGWKYGVTYRTDIVSVRISECDGRGTSTDEAVVAGLDWVTEHHQGQSVANMSVGPSAPYSFSPEILAAMSRLTASGVTLVLAAGNDGRDACTIGAVPADALVAGAIDRTDSRSVWNSDESSNFGSCVDLYAPGTDVPTDAPSSQTATVSGTSFAAPHVAGAAALYLEAHPGATPEQVHDALVQASTPIRVGEPGRGDLAPARLLFVAPMRLSSSALTFHTPDDDQSDDKDADTDVTIDLRGNGDQVLATVDLPHDQFPDGSTFGPYGMHLAEAVGLRDLRGGRWHGDFTPHGAVIGPSHDTWTFTMTGVGRLTGAPCTSEINFEILNVRTPNSGGTLDWSPAEWDPCVAAQPARAVSRAATRRPKPAGIAPGMRPTPAAGPYPTPGGVVSEAQSEQAANVPPGDIRRRHLPGAAGAVALAVAAY